MPASETRSRWAPTDSWASATGARTDRRLGHDRAAALGPGDADRDGHAGLALQLAELVLVVAGRREQQLDVGAGQPLAAAGEGLARWRRRKSARRARSSASGRSRGRAEPARQLVDRHRVLDPVRDADWRSGRTDWRRRRADRGRRRRRSTSGAHRADARDLQQMRRVDGAARQDHLARGPHPPVSGPSGGRRRRRSACPRTAAWWRTPWSRRAGCGAAFRLGQEGARGRAAETAVARHLREADALVLATVEVLGQRNAGLLRGIDEPAGQIQGRAVVLDQDRPAFSPLLRSPGA